MKEQYKRICHFLHIGYWCIDLTENHIQFDLYLQKIFQLKTPTIGIDYFIDLVHLDEKEAVLSALQQVSKKQAFSLQFNVGIGKNNYFIEAVLDPSGTTNADGYIRILNSGLAASENILNTPSFTKELHVRLNLACQTDLIFPFSWDFRNHLLEFTTLENGQIQHKQLSLSEFSEFIDVEDRSATTTKLMQFADHKMTNFKIRFRSGHFEKKQWFEMAGEVYKISDENVPIQAIGVLHDVSEQVFVQHTQGKNEQLLLEAQKEIKSAISDRKLALDNLNTALVYMNRDFIVQWNSMKTMKAILGEKAYAVGEPCYKSTFHRDSPCEDCPVTKLFSSKKPEMHKVERNGEILEVMANPVFDQNKELIGGVLKLDKITERVKQENLILELNTLMDAILNHIPVYLYLKDPNDEFKYLYWNKALADSTQLPASRVIGRTDDEILHSKSNARLFRKNDVELLESEGKMFFIEEYEDTDGNLKVVSSLKTLIPAPHKKHPWVLGISWDITELKKNEKELILAKEKAEESNRLKSAFLANMSHEIRTPLNAIVGFSDLLSETDDKSEKTEYIDIIRNNNELLLQLISDILDLAKIEAQSMDFAYDTVNMYELINQVVAAGNMRKEAKVPVILGRSEADCYLYTDKNRVNQVLSNFISNALKFTSEGNVKVGYYSTSPTAVKFYVSDTGTGISPDKQEAVFERFVKLDNFKQGTGLGLSICKSIVEELKGTIGLESEPNKGSCFWFTLPRNHADKNNADATKNTQLQKRVVAKIQLKKQLEHKPTILVAEDTDSNYTLVDRSLKDRYNLVRARNGKEAVELYNRLKPDIILMDIQMPEMDGLEAAETIRKKDQHIPIIAFSAYSFSSNPEKARKAGCDDFIATPVSAHTLRDKINSYITFLYGKQ